MDLIWLKVLRNSCTEVRTHTCFAAECRDNWTKIGQNCFKLVNHTYTWRQALVCCENTHHSRLASIINEEENSNLFEIMNKVNVDRAWIGKITSSL